MLIRAQPAVQLISPLDNDVFSKLVFRIREELRERPHELHIWASIAGLVTLPGGCEVWYGESPHYYVKLIGGPGTLARKIMEMKTDLPRYNCNLEIIDDAVHEVDHKIHIPPAEVDDDLEDCTNEVMQLPLISVVDPEKHFVKSPTYKQEIGYLLQCKGSKYIVQLIGRTEKGDLIFDKVDGCLVDSVVTRNTNKTRIQTIKKWMLDIIDGLIYLHSMGIVHRDLVSRNILDPGLDASLIICDLQCLNASALCSPYELDGGDYSRFSFASDVFGLGSLLWQCSFYNDPFDRHVMIGNPPPVPFRDIFLACTMENPDERPTLLELKAMYEAIVFLDGC
ncbi:kinase-like protein [Pholiota conissans]|uniref:Kinase-like protein n=1 Tax=Pholiota conissans TaxID=109636 RepID=A0A9P6CP09_9AGAR|nr:kinase-like protein [Pholiota conissans]